ncbi:MAG: FmdB family transcriptional regulator [Candidatus Eremiobacteraeota bacterium]|nr:FmdB family transcriptional regulator [Candidatus Eremiobacteraeota bacterium]
MPVYEYRCKDCGKTHEIEHGFHDERPTSCPSCSGRLVRVFHPVGVVFKGSGFHKTDYTSSGARQDPAGSETAKGDQKPQESKAADAKASPAKTDAKSTADSKPSKQSGDTPSPSKAPKT